MTQAVTRKQQFFIMVLVLVWRCSLLPSSSDSTTAKILLEGLLQAWGRLSAATVTRTWYFVLLRLTAPVDEPAQAWTQGLEQVVELVRSMPRCGEMSAEDMMEVVSDMPHTLEAVTGALISDKHLQRQRLVKDYAAVCQTYNKGAE